MDCLNPVLAVSTIMDTAANTPRLPPTISEKPEPVTDLKPYNQTPGCHHVIKDVYSFFGKNVQNSVAVYVGVEDWKLDLQILESYAFPTVVCDPFYKQEEWFGAVLEKRGKLMDWMKYLKDSGCGSHFVNPKWIDPVIDFPGPFDGTRKVVDRSDETCMVNHPVSSWETLVNKAASLRNKNVTGAVSEPHFAVCKIELYNEEINVLASLLASKYRPSILYLRWSASPDESHEHCEAAGHLQSCGYRLISINSNGYFLYQYSGQDIYSCASWTNVGIRHPLIQQVQEEVTTFLRQTGISNARSPCCAEAAGIFEEAKSGDISPELPGSNIPAV